MVVVDCYTALGGIAAAGHQESSDVTVGESLGAFAVDVQAFRTRYSKPRHLDHSRTGPVVVSMSEIVQNDLWQGKDQRGLERDSCWNPGAVSVLNAAV